MARSIGPGGPSVPGFEAVDMPLACPTAGRHGVGGGVDPVPGGTFGAVGDIGLVDGIGLAGGGWVGAPGEVDGVPVESVEGGGVAVVSPDPPPIGPFGGGVGAIGSGCDL